MRSVAFIALSIALCLAGGPIGRGQTETAFSGWPGEIDGKRLERRPFTPLHYRILRGFPGRAGLFGGEDVEVLYRWSPQVTNTLRSVHQAFREEGYRTSERASAERDGVEWTCFLASKGLDRIRICERLYDTKDRTWSDFDDWLLEAKAARTRPPWWAVAVIEPVDPL